MTAIIRALLTGSNPAGDDPQDLVELGKQTLRKQAERELASDLLGLDGVALPLKLTPGLN